MSIVDVYIWGTKVGSLGYAPGQTEFATFEYDPDFVSRGIEISPVNAPISKSLHEFDDISQRTFHGLPGFIADSLPDKFGNQLIDQYFTSKGKTTKEITALDRLLYIGDRSMGALEYRPSIEFENYNEHVKLNLQDLSNLAEMILSKKNILAEDLKNADRETAIHLLRIGSSAGGARSKALVAVDEEGNLYDGTINHSNINCRYYLLKFDHDNNSDREQKDPKGITKVEYIYSQIAKECDIDIPDTTYIKIEDDFHFLIERFDRIDQKDHVKDKLHYVSWCGIAHADRDVTGAYSYEQLVMTAREMDLGQDEIKEIFKRAVFNIVGRNQDDHTKNFGFLMDREGNWSLSPAFDMVYSYDPSGKWTQSHQIKFSGKQDNFTSEDIVKFGKFCGINEKNSLKILNKTVTEFLKFEGYAKEYKVSDELTNTILKNLRTDIGTEMDNVLKQIENIDLKVSKEIEMKSIDQEEEEGKVGHFIN